MIVVGDHLVAPGELPGLELQRERGVRVEIGATPQLGGKIGGGIRRRFPLARGVPQPMTLRWQRGSASNEDSTVTLPVTLVGTGDYFRVRDIRYPEPTSNSEWSRRARRPVRSCHRGARLLNEDHSAVVLTWKLLRARPVGYRFSPLNALGAEAVTEILELAFERLEME